MLSPALSRSKLVLPKTRGDDREDSTSEDETGAESSARVHFTRERKYFAKRTKYKMRIKEDDVKHAHDRDDGEINEMRTKRRNDRDAVEQVVGSALRKRKQPVEDEAPTTLPPAKEKKSTLPIQCFHPILKRHRIPTFGRQPVPHHNHHCVAQFRKPPAEHIICRHVEFTYNNGKTIGRCLPSRQKP